MPAGGAHPMADFRSDTLTPPTDRMREAMARAEVGDDVFGEDPTIRRLEAAGAELTGMAAALFVPSGTMGNQIAVHVHCQPGDELICEERSHVFQFEGASVARLSGTQVRTLPAERGFRRLSAEHDQAGGGRQQQQGQNADEVEAVVLAEHADHQERHRANGEKDFRSGREEIRGDVHRI